MKPKILIAALCCFAFSVLTCFGSPTFRQNRGQWPVEFQFRITTDYNQVSFAPHSILRSFKDSKTGTFTTYRTHFYGADPNTKLKGNQPTEAAIHYFKQTTVPISTQEFQTLEYTHLYPGIDAEYYLQDNHLKYDLIVQPSGNPEDIQFGYEGIESVERAKDGSLVLYTAEGSFSEGAPFAYQLKNGEKIIVPARYVVNEAAKISFEFPDGYDQDVPLVIDPVVLEWSTYLGGDSLNMGGRLDAITVDADGFIYGTGAFFEGFPTTPGVIQSVYKGGSHTGSWGEVLAADAIIFKLDPTGTNLIWSAYLGGSRGDVGKDLKVDERGRVYVMGWTDSDDFPTTKGVFQEDPAPFFGIDVFVARLDADGTLLKFATYYGGVGDDYGLGLDINDIGDVFVTGATNGGQIPVTPNAYDKTYNGAPGFSDGFIFRASGNASNLVYSTFFGGSESESGEDIVVNDQDEVFVTGENNSPDFPTTPGAYQAVRFGVSSSAYALKLSADGSQLLMSTYVGGSRGDYATAIAINQNGEPFITGRTSSGDWPTTTGAYDTLWNNAEDVFMTQLSADGTQLLYSTFLGGFGREIGTAIALNRNEEIFVAGNTISPGFPTTECAYDSLFRGGGGRYFGGDIFLSKFSPDGKELVYSTLIGGPSDDSHARMALDERNCSTEVVLGITTQNTGFPVTAGSYREDPPRSNNFMAIAKFREDLQVQTIIQPDSCPQPGQLINFEASYDTCGGWSGRDSWEWSFGDGITAPGLFVDHVYAEPGTYTAGLRYKGCPLNLEEHTIRLLELDLGEDISLCVGETQDVAAAHPDAVAWLWENGSTNPFRTFEDSGMYVLEMWDSSGCSVKDTMQVELVNADFVVSNVFTPNGDQINDYFHIKGIENRDWALQVFDRWGSLKYEVEAYQNDWNGDQLQPGVYYYILEGPGECGHFAGWVTLLR